MASRGDKIRRSVFWGYLVLALSVLSCVIYEFIVNTIPWTFWTAKMASEEFRPPLADDLCEISATNLIYLSGFGIFIIITIILAVVLFIATRKTFKQPIKS